MNISKVKKEFIVWCFENLSDDDNTLANSGGVSGPELSSIGKNIWSFIEHSLLTQRKDIIKKIEGKKKQPIDYSKPENKYAEFPKEYVGYNQAIDDIINQIK